MTEATFENEYAVSAESIQKIQAKIAKYCNLQTNQLKMQLKMWQRKYQQRSRALTSARSRNSQLRKLIKIEREKAGKLIKIEQEKAGKSTTVPLEANGTKAAHDEVKVDLTQDIEQIKLEMGTLKTALHNILSAPLRTSASANALIGSDGPIAAASTSTTAAEATTTMRIDSVLISSDSDGTAKMRNGTNTATSSLGISTFQMDSAHQFKSSTPKPPPHQSPVTRQIKRPHTRVNYDEQSSSSYGSSSDDDRNAKRKKSNKRTNQFQSSSGAQSNTQSATKMRCYKCRQVFYHIKDWENHHYHVCVKPFNCRHCDATFKTDNGSKSHKCKVQPKWKKEE